MHSRRVVSRRTAARNVIKGMWDDKPPRRLGMMRWSLRVMEAHTQASGSDAFGDLVAESLIERDVAFFEDAVEELRVRSASATGSMRR